MSNLSKHETIWKGFLNMQSVAKFVTKGCMISGSAEVLKKVRECVLDITDSSVSCVNAFIFN